MARVENPFCLGCLVRKRLSNFFILVDGLQHIL